MTTRRRISALLLIALLWILPNFAFAQSCICLKCAFGAYKSYWAPAASMVPSIVPGQCFVARRLTPQSDTVALGDIVTFRHPVTGVDYVKRVVALAGDSVELVDGVLWLNEVPVLQTPLADHIVPFDRSASGSMPVCANAPQAGAPCRRHQWQETLPNGVSYPILDIGPTALDHIAKTVVPQDHVYVLGDHRDNSVDSRLPHSSGGPGFVPVSAITGIVTIEEETE